MTTAGHDSAVIGGGISGLVCAGLLSSAGRSVILVEKNDVPGGCCSSFARRGYRFDTGTSSISGLGEGGRLNGILSEIGVRIEFIRPDIRETIVTPHFTLEVPSGWEQFKDRIMGYFRRDRRSLRDFFDILEKKTAPRTPAAGSTFADVTDSLGFSGEVNFFFEALLGNLGLPAGKVDARTALAFFREYVVDGGYYPRGGMAHLITALIDRITEQGGEVMPGTEAVSLDQSGDRTGSLGLSGGGRLQAEFIVSAMDARRTCELAGCGPDELGRLDSLGHSPSAFMVFLGTDCPLDRLTGLKGHILHLPEGNMDAIYRSLSEDELLFSEDEYVFIIAPSRITEGMAPEGCESLCLFILAPYRNDAFWKANRQRMVDILVKRADNVVPGLSRHIAVMDSSTPLTIGRYTGGSRGAIYGWEATPGQSGSKRLSPVIPRRNICLAGHWTRPGSGISASAYSGKLAARMALRHLEE